MTESALAAMAQLLTKLSKEILRNVSLDPLVLPTHEMTGFSIPLKWQMVVRHTSLSIQLDKP